MHKPVALLCRTLGCLCLAFSVGPVVLFGVINAGVVILFLLGVALWVLPLAWWKLRRRVRRVLIVAGSACFIGACAFSAVMIKYAWFNPPPEAGADVVLVLGAKVNGNQPSLMLKQRLDAALSYLAAYPEALCIVSGGRGADETVEEARVMADYLMGKGIAENRVYLEMSATNTLENIAYSAHILEDITETPSPSVLIVTQDFHQMRAALYAGHLGIEERYSLSVPSPWGLVPCYWIREWPALCKAFLVDLRYSHLT